MQVYRIEQIREIERRCRARGLNEGALMERAAWVSQATLKRHWPKARYITIVCGSGYNAGDGFALARLLHRSGLQVMVQYLVPLENLEGATKEMAKACQREGIVMHLLQSDVWKADVVVDAILGIGLKGSVRDAQAKAIAAINQAGCPVFALDVPSGVDADTGAVHTCAVSAQVTCTFVGIKRGLLTGEALTYVGTLEWSSLDLPSELFSDIFPDAQSIALSNLAHHLKPRKLTSYKNQCGHVLVTGGDRGFQGAVVIAARAAYRAGVGLVSLATRAEHAPMVVTLQPEIMVHGVNSANDLQPLIQKATGIIIGPGLGDSEWARELFSEAIASQKPLVIDADALTLLAHAHLQSAHWILTPHPGEAARLLKCDVAQVQANRFQAAKQIQQQYGGICVLKGAGTLIANDTMTEICREGNPGMASAGMGDALSGIIGSFIAQGFSLSMAASLGVCVHARAGDLAAKEGERGLLATDLLPYIRRLVNP